VEGIVVLQHGRESARHHWIPEALKDVYSVSKGFSSIAVGMAIGEGKLSLSSRVIDAFPELIPALNAGSSPEQASRLASLTLEHLLTMSRGFSEFSRPSTVQEALAQPLSHEPGSLFVYDNGSTFLASAMLTRALGETLRDYLCSRLFGPLGFPALEWNTSTDGHTLGATGLRAGVSHLALFGQFLLQRGNWKGKQLVPERWIDCAGRPHIGTGYSKRPDHDLGYGYWFWPCRHGAYRVDGKNGQFVVVLPGENAVIAIVSDEENMKPILRAVWEEIFPLLRNGD
jgi:CubicO group peptidase (beta-lactamase class C family)